VTPDAVYQLLVDANPVPDPDGASRPSMNRRATRDPGHTPTHTVDVRDIGTNEDEHQLRTGHWASHRRWILTAAATLLLIGLLSVLAALRSNNVDERPADVPLPTTTPTREELAVQTARTFYAALHAGDVDTVIAMSNAAETDLARDREMWAMNALMIDHGETRTIESCEPTAALDAFVEVTCTITTDHPLFDHFGNRELVNPARIYDDDTVRWLPMIGQPYAEPNEAYAEYLRAFEPAAYEADCDPAAYQVGSITSNRGLALTLRCAEVWVPLTSDVVRWVEAGRPTS
jgi:hypothetical protein